MSANDKEPIPYPREVRLVIRRLKKECAIFVDQSKRAEVTRALTLTWTLATIAEAYRQWSDYHTWQRRTEYWQEKLPYAR